jgi:hypothetical protein
MDEQALHNETSGSKQSAYFMGQYSARLLSQLCATELHQPIQRTWEINLLCRRCGDLFVEENKVGTNVSIKVELSNF